MENRCTIYVSVGAVTPIYRRASYCELADQHLTPYNGPEPSAGYVITRYQPGLCIAQAFMVGMHRRCTHFGPAAKESLKKRARV